EILRAADSDGADIELARLLVCRLDEIAERLVWRGRIDRELQIELAEHRDHLEVLDRIERELLEQRDADRRAVGDEAERVAVGCRGDHRACSIDAAWARHILDIEPLAEFLAELIRDNARGDVGDSAGAEGQHELHRPFRPFCLRRRDKRYRQQYRSQSQQHPPPYPRLISRSHCRPPPSWRRLVVIVRNHKAAPGFPPAGGVVLQHQARSWAPDRRDQPRPPRASHSGAESRYPKAHGRRAPRPAPWRSGSPRRKAAWRCARRRTP